VTDKTNDILCNKPDPLTKGFKKLDISNIIINSCGYMFYVCICKNGVFSLGHNYCGQLGIGNLIGDWDFQQILFFKNPEEIISISCGFEFSVCVCKNGVFSWGDNYFGQLGIGNQINQSSPQQILFFKNTEEIISLSCGGEFSICICKNGVFSWGFNNSGQLGIGNNDHQSSPQQILFFKNPEEIISLSCGRGFSICICKNGVFSWGDNFGGQLGIGNQINQSSPQQISFFKNIEEIISLSCGNSHSICICKNGVFSWGWNKYGQLGIGNKINQSSPQQIFFFKNPEEIISFCCGYDFCVCICENGIFAWGDNQYKQLGIEKKIKFNIKVFEDYYSIPQSITFKEEIESFYNLSFSRSPFFMSIYIKKFILILAREYLNPDECLVGKYYLPWDIFKILLRLIK